jgi:Endonuclease/Exonuclease/phosphatase family
VGLARWPGSSKEYVAKCKRIDAALKTVCGKNRPQILAFAEITDRAASELRDRLFPGYSVHSLDTYEQTPELQVAILFDPQAGFVDESIFVANQVPLGTRPMATIDHEFDGNRIRFYACHWSARFRVESENTRSDTARQLSIAVYQFLKEARKERRHIVVLGDLNEEPFGLVEERLFADRSRARARSKEHYSDKSISRLRLYNCSWRWLGERIAHVGDMTDGHTAGTYYWEEEKKWRTFDQVIVSGSLLTDRAPFLDEQALKVQVNAEIMGHELMPRKFKMVGTRARGLSDHLPICGRIVLQRGKNHD